MRCSGLTARSGRAEVRLRSPSCDERRLAHDERSPFDAWPRSAYGRTDVDVLLGMLLGLVLAASLVAGSRLLARPRSVLSPEAAASRVALHAVTATLPHLRGGLTPASAAKAAPHLRTLVGAPAVALCRDGVVLAWDGAGADHHRAGDDVGALLDPVRPDRLHVEPDLRCTAPGCPLGAAVVAPIVVGGDPVGALVACHPSGGRLRPEDTRAAQEAASLVAAQLALAELDAQAERLAQAELRALRAQISPHFVYNAMAAIASSIHRDPDGARELLTEFAEFTRYAFRSAGPYVTLAEELRYVEKYLRLEQARFGDRLRVRIEVAPEVLQAVVPVLSVQPLVENAVRHGLERHEGGLHVELLGRDLGNDVELRVCDDGPGIADPEAALAGTAGGGIGLSNVQQRLRQTYGAPYGLRIDRADPGGGAAVSMVVPKFRAGVRAA